MSELQDSPGARPATEKQLSYIKSLRKKVHALLGSQTPPEFMRVKDDSSLNVLIASILINSMKSVLENGTPPVRPVTPKSDESGYEGELVLPFPLDGTTCLRVWVKWPQRSSPWAWLCFNIEHPVEVESDQGFESKRAALADVEQHWQQFHGDDFPGE